MIRTCLTIQYLPYKYMYIYMIYIKMCMSMIAFVLNFTLNDLDRVNSFYDIIFTLKMS